MTADREAAIRDRLPHERDYIARTIETVRNHKDADNCWPQWANIFADQIEALEAELAAARDALTITDDAMLDYQAQAERLSLRCQEYASELAAAREREQTLREMLRKHRKQCPGVVEFMDGHVEDCVACAALAAAEEQGQ